MSEPHKAQAFVLMCMDFRFHKQVIQRLEEMGITAFDIKADAGAAKYLISADKPAVREWIIENIEISKRLHHIDSIVLINHSDCGAYGGNTAFGSEENQKEFHTGQLEAAKTLLTQKFPDLQIKTFYAVLSDSRVALEQV